MRVAALLLFIPTFAFAAPTEPPAQPTGKPLTVEIPRDPPTEQKGLPPGAALLIGSRHTIRGLEHQFSYSPGGKHVAGGTTSRHVRVWEVATGKAVHNFGPFAPSGLSSRIIAKTVFSPDGKTLAVAAGKFAHLFDLTTGKEVGKLQGHTHVVDELIFSNDGKRIVTGSFDQTVAIWDRQSFKRLHSISYGKAVFGIAISPNAELFAVLDQRGKIKLWNAQTGTALREFDGLYSTPSALHFSDDGKTLLGVGHDEGLLEWEVATGEIKKRIPEMKGMAVQSLDGTMLATVKDYSSSDGITLWDLKTGKSTGKFAGERSGILTFAIAPDNRGLASHGSDGILRFWKLPSGEEVNPPVGHQDRVTAVGVARDGKSIISASEDGTVRFWDAASGREMKRLSVNKEHMHAMALSSDGKTLAIVGSAMPRRWRWQIDADKQSLNLRFWDIEAGKELRAFSINGDVPGWIRFTGDDREILSLGYQEVRLIDAKTGKDRRPVGRAEQGFPAADISPNGRYLATSSNVPALRQIGKIAYFDLIDNKEVFSKTFYLGGYSGLAFTPDGKYLAVAGTRGFREDKEKKSPLQLWEVPGEKTVRSFDYAGDNAHLLTFSRDGRMLATVEGNRISVFEVATGKLRQTFDGHEGAVTSIAFSRDGRQLVSGGDDSRVFAWDLTGIHGKRPFAKIDAKDLDELWNDLSSSDAVVANKSLWRLAARPQESLVYMKFRLIVLKDEDLNRIEKLVAQLDDEQFRVRDRAAKDLEKIGEAAVPVLNKALSHKSVEVRQTAERLLKKIGDGEDPVTSPDARRTVRAIEALERIGDADARALLKELQGRGSKLIQHREADAALRRLTAE